MVSSCYYQRKPTTQKKKDPKDVSTLNKIEMNGDGITLTSVAEIVLMAQSDLKAEAMNVAIKASTELKAEASASAEVSSSGTMTVKGALVQIN